MNVSFLTPWLSGFHTVQFSGSSGYFLFFNLLLSFFRLCEEAKYISLRFHLDRKLFFLLFRERVREGEKGGEKHQCVVASYVPPTGDLASNPDMCPDRELNWRPFGS